MSYKPSTCCWILLLLTGLLCAYCLFFVVFEGSTSQQAVRPYFTDIAPHENRLYGVNTTLSAFLLWTSAVCFLIALSFSDKRTSVRDRIFYGSQAVLFISLGMSDRFMLHEWLAEVIWQHDVVFYGLLGGFQVISLWFYGRRFLLMPACLLWLFLAGVAFGIMALLDMFAPHDMYLRLSLEDGFKVWSGFFFVLYSWSILKIQSREYFESPD